MFEKIVAAGITFADVFVEFERQEEVVLQILTADARKYFAAKLQEQMLL